MLFLVTYHHFTCPPLYSYRMFLPTWKSNSITSSKVAALSFTAPSLFLERQPPSGSGPSHSRGF